MNEPPEIIRVRGQVQGVGMRPTIARLASQLGLPGWVKNDADGVLIALGGDAAARERFMCALLSNPPPLARMQEVVRHSTELEGAARAVTSDCFEIRDSVPARAAAPQAQVVPDAATCADCAAEILDPCARRHRYPLTNCTHCGPRFSITLALPWDRVHTSMASFALCTACRAEYEDPADRRYHAEPIACPRCGPRVRVTRSDGEPFAPLGSDAVDAVDAIARLLEGGAVVALKGVGGYQLLADATQEAVVTRLRERKQRPEKPFALMARDLAMVRDYCQVSREERAALCDPSAPIVLLTARTRPSGPPLAPALLRLPRHAVRRHGCMLPSTPLHMLALRRMSRPVVCTSGNHSDEPQVIDDREVRARLGHIADFVVSHDRPIHNRVDDSVVRVFGGKTRVLRRARGLAPAPWPLPAGFEGAAASTQVLAAGTDLKAAICLSRTRDLVLSQHLGDLDDPRNFTAYAEQCERLRTLFAHRPTCVVVDNHPDSRAAQHARALAEACRAQLLTVDHHHAHFAACLGDNGVALDDATRLGLVLDGLGTGEDGHAAWGCELLAGGYAHVVRLGTLLPTALIGGDRAAREPWRCLYAQLRAALPADALRIELDTLRALAPLRAKPLATLDALCTRGIAVPQASSCGRLFDAVAAALGVCFERQSFEAQAAQALEALVAPDLLRRAQDESCVGQGYVLPVTEAPTGALLVLDPRPMWRPLLNDLRAGAAPGLVAARMHVALAAGLRQLCRAALQAQQHAGRALRRELSLSGGCLQNAVLHQCLHEAFSQDGYTVLTHAGVPANDGGIALGQALVALARTSAHAGLLPRRP